jgi:hypothetical protein
VATALHTTLKTNTTLSGGNLVATSTGAGGARSDRAITGLTYFSAVLTTLTGAPRIGIASTNWNTNNALGSGTDSLGYVPTTGVVAVNGVTLTTIQTSAQGDRIDVAVDAFNRLIWFRTNNGNWNNNVANNPVTGVGGIDFTSGMTLFGTMVAAVYASLTGTVWTMQLSTAFTNTPPTGFQSLDVVAISAISSVPPTQFIGSYTAAGFGVSAAKECSTRGKHFSGPGPVTVVSGTTKESGVTVSNKKVEVYDRDTGELLGTTYSDGSGNWSVPALGRPTVRVVGSDPTTYNSVVYDNVVPV